MSRLVTVAQDDEIEYPPALERALRMLLGVAFLLVLLLPIAASIEARSHQGLPLLDAGASTAAARAVLNCLVLMATVFMLLLPPASGARGVSTCLGVFLIIWTAATFFSVCVADSVQSWLSWVVAALFMAVAREVARTRPALELALRVMLAIAFIVTVTGLALLWETGAAEGSFTGAFYQADVAAGYLLLMAPLAFGLLLASRGWAERFFYGTVLMVLLAALFLSYSRGGQLAVAGAISTAAVLMAWRGRRWVAIILAPAVLLLGLFAAGLIASGGQSVIPQRTVERTMELARAALDDGSDNPAGQPVSSSVTARMNFYRGGWDMARARPWTGWGPATFGRVFPRYQEDVRYYSKYAHSAYITILSEGGFAALAAFLAFALALMVWGLRHIWAAADDPWRLGALVGLLCGVLGALLHVVIDVDWEFPMVQTLFFGLAGLLLSPAASARPGTEQAVFTSHRKMMLRWSLCIPILGLMALQPFPFLGHFADHEAGVERGRGNLDLAIAQERRATSLMPFHSTYYRRLAELLLAKGESDPQKNQETLGWSIDAARVAVSLDPYRAVNHDMLARALLTAGRSGEAAEAERQAIVCDPVNYPQFYNVLAELLMLPPNPDLAEAKRLLTGIASKYPPEMFPTMWFFRQETLSRQLSHTWFLIAGLEQRQGRSEEAARAYTRAIELNRQNMAARFQLGTLRMNRGEPALAYTQFLALQELKPAHGVSSWLMGLCYRELGQFARATQLLNEAWKQYPSLRQGRGEIRIPSDYFSVPDRAQPELEYVR